MKTINAFDASHLSQLPEAEQALIRRRERLLGPAYRLFYQQPVHLVRGEGVWLFDAQGRRYLDAYNNVASLGHAHPKVVAALHQQAATLNTHTRYLHESLLDYAERLLATLPEPIDRVMFTCSGSEANDLALRLAQLVTGGTGVIVTELAYHGVTQITAACSPSLGAPLTGPPPHVFPVPAPRAVAAAGQAPDEAALASLGARFAQEIDAAVARMRSQGVVPAALLLDSLFTSDGVYPEPAGFLQAVVQRARMAGMLVIADEVQPGFARTGSHFWGHGRHGITPDIVTLGKPMGNGHPMAGLCTRSGLLDEFGRRTRYFNTFGGNTVSAAVGMAVLDVIEREGLQQNALEQGRYLAQQLRVLESLHTRSLVEVRHAGLFFGIELRSPSGDATDDAAFTTRVVNGMRERGVLLSACGPRANILKIRPPLVLQRAHADLLVRCLDESLRASAHPLGQGATP